MRTTLRDAFKSTSIGGDYRDGMTKPRVFVGSSSETIDLAEALFERLERDALVETWNGAQLFAPTKATLQSLVDIAPTFDFAVFILTNDDVVVSRGQDSPVPRDNVIFELGLFIGAIGADRTLLAYDRGAKPKLPTDLSGITYVGYETRGYSDANPAVTGVARAVKRKIAELGTRHERLSEPPSVYWCGPHADRSNADVKAALEAKGVTVYLPDDLVTGAGVQVAGAARAAEIQRLCCEAISACDVMAVNLDSYGLDSAWEMGYAEALGKPIVGYNRSDELLDARRIVNKWPYVDNFMHGWHEDNVFRDLDEVAGMAHGRTVYLFCPYRNGAAIEEVAASSVAKTARRLIISNRDLGVNPDDPGTYIWRTRKRAVQLLGEADLILVVLPRYGMDTAWKMGYAAALGKDIVGWLTDDFGRERSNADFLDHWMHGWRKKPVVSTIDDLTSMVVGLSYRPHRSHE